MRNRDLNNKERLEQIADAIEKIEMFCAGINEQIFIDDLKLNSAVLLHFVIMGEAIVNIEPELLQRYPYSWYKVKSFRNIVAHQYHKISMKMVWNIVEFDLPELKKMIQIIIKNNFR